MRTIQRAGPHAAERHSRMRAFLDEYRYAPAHDLREVAEELYDEVGSISMTLIDAKIKRRRNKLQSSRDRQDPGRPAATIMDHRVDNT